jgi:hypothetical protein
MASKDSIATWERNGVRSDSLAKSPVRIHQQYLLNSILSLLTRITHHSLHQRVLVSLSHLKIQKASKMPRSVSRDPKHGILTVPVAFS